MGFADENDATTHPLRDYAFSGDGERGIIIDPDGSIVWMCAPRWDSDAVFSSLLGGAGHFSVTPQSAHRFSGGYYDEGTLIWRHVWTTCEGVIECDDALAYPGEDHRAVILRRIASREHAHQVDVAVSPRAGFGYADITPATLSDGVWTWTTGDVHVRVAGLADARFSPEEGLVGSLHLEASAEHDVVAEFSIRPDEDGSLDADTLWASTREAWRRAVPDIRGTASDEDVAQFYAVATGLTSRHGGMVAAATAGLPERLEAAANYDYRYAWIRDQCFAGHADAALGGDRKGGYPLLDGAVAFIGARLLADGANLRPAYTVAGEPVPSERKLPLPGYPGAVPITGNHVNEQFQLDVFGEALSLFAAAARLGRLDEQGWDAAHITADAIAERWQEPDAGIWELENRWWTHSRLACVGGLRALSDAAPDASATTWRALADTIEERLLATCTTADGRWTRAQDDDAVDAALIIPAFRGGLDPHDPVNVHTVDAVLRDLERGGHLYRFKHGDEDLRSAEGAFLLCEASMSLALLRLGRREEAVRWFERVRGCVGPSGLFSEEWNVQERQMRGNLPQAFVHALVAQAAIELSLGHGSDHP